MASLLDPRFKYVPSHSTDIRQTWQRFGFKPNEPRAVAGVEWQSTRRAPATVKHASNEESAAIAA
jgi:hypothetical protein